MPNIADFFYELAKMRRSIRQFKKTVIEREVLERILECALHAPSGKNRQNWRFFVLQGEKKNEYLQYSKKSWLGIKDILSQRLKPSLYDFTERFFMTLGNAPVVVLAYSSNSPEERYLTSIGSVYMAVQNINLACVAEGLGCCTMGAPLEIKNEIDVFLGVDQLDEYKKGELELLCAIAIGYADHEPPKAQRIRQDRITYFG